MGSRDRRDITRTGKNPQEVSSGTVEKKEEMKETKKKVSITTTDAKDIVYIKVQDTLKVIKRNLTLEELEREIKWIRTEWRQDYSSARACVKRDKVQVQGRIYKILKIPNRGFAILIYGREKQDYENISQGREWAI